MKEESGCAYCGRVFEVGEIFTREENDLYIWDVCEDCEYYINNFMEKNDDNDEITEGMFKEHVKSSWFSFTQRDKKNIPSLPEMVRECLGEEN